MKIVVITPDWEFPKETEIIRELFENGLWRLHVRKPNYSKNALKQYLNQIPEKYHSKIIIHSIKNKKLMKAYNLRGLHLNSKERTGPFMDALKVGSLKLINPGITITTTFRTQKNLEKASRLFDYLILNNIFKSRSKKSFKRYHDWTKLENTLKNRSHKILARGGVKKEKIPEIRNLGFDGATFMRELWDSEDPIQKFLEISDLANKHQFFDKIDA